MCLAVWVKKLESDDFWDTVREFSSGLLLHDGILYSLGKYLPLLSDLGQAPNFLRALLVKSFCKYRLPTPRATCCLSETGGIQLEFVQTIKCWKNIKKKPTGNLLTIFDPAIHYQLAITQKGFSETTFSPPLSPIHLCSLWFSSSLSLPVSYVKSWSFGLRL